MDNLELLFVGTAFTFQGVLIIHFALRRWAFDFAMKYGWIVYALSIPAVAVSKVLLLGGKTWSLWLGGFLFFFWAAFGFFIEYIKKIEWRAPMRGNIFGPYVILYLATVMFYWWPLALIYRPLWYVYAALFVIGTFLNVTSHRKTERVTT